MQITTLPGSPRALIAFPASPTSISLSWSPPVTDGGSPIIGYKIEYRTGTFPYAIAVENTGNQQTSYIHTGLATGTSVTYRVSAINSIGTGSPSNEASAVPQQTLTPIIVGATATSPTTVSLSWLAPSQTYGESIVGYRIDQIISASASVPIVDNTGMTTSYTIAHLITGQTYTFTVTALYLGGTQSNPSAQASVTPTSSSGQSSKSSPSSQQNQATPNAPAALNATLISHSTIKLSWLAPSNNGKPPVTGYRVEFKSGSANWSVLVSNIGLETSYFHTELAADTTYTYRMYAINTIGVGTPSNEVSVTTPSNNPTTQTPSVQPQLASGMISVANTTSISYNIAGGQVVGAGINLDTFSLHVQLRANSEGILFVELPRDMIDAKKTDDSDTDYIITTDQSLAKFNETKNASLRTLAIEFPAGTKLVP